MVSIALIITCVLLTAVVLIQNSKGGGVQGQYLPVKRVMGVKEGKSLIEKTTWTLAIMVFVFSLLI